MHRRRFLEATALGSVALSLPGLAWAKAPSFERDVLARPDLLATLSESQVRTIGFRYREAFPHENDAAILKDAIVNQHRPALPLPAHLKQQVQKDFAAGRTVLVDGWVLSVTEARQCALFSLLYA